MADFVPRFFFAEGCAHSISLLQLLKATNLSGRFEMVDATSQSSIRGTPALHTAAGEPVLYGDSAFDYVSSAAMAVAAEAGAKEAQPRPLAADFQHTPRGSGGDAVPDSTPPPVSAACTIDENALKMFDCEAMMPREN